MDRAPLIHIGNHKTGTTWLQRFVFKDRQLGFDTPFHRDDLNQMIVLLHALDFDPQPCRDRFAPVLEKYHTQGLVPVFSSERFGGHPHAGGYDSKTLADRLARAFPDANVLIVIREQKRSIFSIYKHYVQKGGPLSPRLYTQPPGARRMPYFDFGYYLYDRLIRHYYTLFGQENVLVLPFEQFQADQRVFVGEIMRKSGNTDERVLDDLEPFYKQEVNVSITGFQVAWQRRWNHLVGYRNSLNVDSLLPLLYRVHGWLLRQLRKADGLVPCQLNRVLDQRLQTHLEALVETAYGERYRASNRATTELIGIDLTAYGYMT